MVTSARQRKTVEENEFVDRQTRFLSHALIEVRRHRWWPFGVQSAVLLDVSLQGFKLEFTGEHQGEIGRTYCICIPLSPLGVYAPIRTLVCHGECKWVDPQRFRMGGTLAGLDEPSRRLMEQVVACLRTRGLDQL